MGVLQSLNKTIAKFYGPSGMRVATGSFTTSGNTGAVTVVEAQGVKSIARTGVGVFLITLARTNLKAIITDISVVGATTAQQFIVTAKDLVNGTVTITQVTAGSGTAVDTLAATVDFCFVLRTQGSN